MPVCANFDLWPSTKCDYGNCSWVESGLMELDFENNILNQAADQLGPGFLLRIGGTLADHVQFDHTETENPGWGKCTCKGSYKNAIKYLKQVFSNLSGPGITKGPYFLTQKISKKSKFPEKICVKKISC